MDLEARVLKVFKEVLEINGAVDTNSLRYNETESWISLAHITLVSALEGEFDIKDRSEGLKWWLIFLTGLQSLPARRGGSVLRRPSVSPSPAPTSWLMRGMTMRS
jgi:acyl carrier protein